MGLYSKLLVGVFVCLQMVHGFSKTNDFCIQGEGIAINKNEIFIKQNAEWASVGFLSDEGVCVYENEKNLRPFMSCSRVEVEWDYKNGIITFTGERDTGKNKENDSSTDREKPDSSDRDRDSDHNRDADR